MHFRRANLDPKTPFEGSEKRSSKSESGCKGSRTPLKRIGAEEAILVLDGLGGKTNSSHG